MARSSVAPKLFTPEEANRLLPDVGKRLALAQDAMRRLRDVRDQLADLRIIWADKIADPSCPDHEEYVSYRDQFTRLELELRDLMGDVTQLGCEVKDADVGLVDFHAARQGETVFLCWRLGEPSIQWWHRIEDGFAGRQPLNKF